MGFRVLSVLYVGFYGFVVGSLAFMIVFIKPTWVILAFFLFVFMVLRCRFGFHVDRGFRCFLLRTCHTMTNRLITLQVYGAFEAQGGAILLKKQQNYTSIDPR